jgi:gliding-associated putative ABC transporter substrate-binding component GldG
MSALKHKKIYWLVAPAVFLALVYLASLVHTRFDLTKEKRYTLSNASTQVLRKIDEPLKVEVFLKGDMPASFQKLANTTGEFLQLLKDNGRAISYRFVAPDETIDGEEKTYMDTLRGMGVQPINLTVQVKQGQESKSLYPYALITYKNQQRLVNLYSGSKRFISAAELNNAEAMMEYSFMKEIDALVNTERPLVGYSMGNGEPADARTYNIQQILRENYGLFTIDINKQPFIPDTFKVLMIVKPSLQFSEDEKLKIDQYLMRGGSVLCFIDNLNAEQDSLGLKPELVAYDRNLNLTDLLFKYGLRINTDLVMDLQCDFMPFVVGGTPDNPQYEFLHWNYYPLFESKGNHPINRNLGLVSGRFVNSIDTTKSSGIQKTVLLSSSANSRRLATPALISLQENRNTPADAQFKQSNIPVAVLAEGNFTSLYRNRITQAQTDSLAAHEVPFTPESKGKGKLIVVADGDMVLNSVSKDGPLPMGVNLFTMGSQYEYQFANADFLQNCLEYLCNKKSIMETRNKEIVLRLLDNTKVEQDKQFWQAVNVAAPVLLVIACGFIYQQIRRKKYAA